MTTLADRPTEGQLWSTMPGWGIVADLTPPELIESRRLHSLRKLIIVALTIVVLMVIAGFAWAMSKHSSATDVADAASSDTTRLEQSEAQYANITQLQTQTAGVKAQIAALTTTDVDMAKMIAQIRGTLPNTMAIQSLNVTISPATPLAPGVVATPGAQQIGTVSISGSGQTLNDLATYIDNLHSVPGVVDILPTDNEQEPKGTHFTLSFQITNARYMNTTGTTTGTTTTGTTGGN